ncbi:MAG: TIGR01777 family oxidoreductase [Verrucomicrobia bacterium]|nr:TIGR01777 family oxidoreductase [Verrucomicrobiota bacterium]MDA1065699.1 TIGR01777 family oxidoreductase [Verrucomicrobiota bacterium]
MASHLYSYESNISAPAADVFAYHERLGALQRLIPPWESVRVVSSKGSIQNDDSITIKMNLGPFKTLWKAKHQDYQKNRQFVDVQVKGPFKYWKHTHSFRSLDPHRTNLKDTIQLELPFGLIGRRFVYPKVLKQLNKLFTYRHAITQNDLKDWMQLKSFPVSKVAITGGNGLIGSELAVFLKAQGHEVVILSRSGKSKVYGVPGVRWDPGKQFIDAKSLSDVDCWIHLAGENVSKKRWTKKRIKKLKDSRVNSTKFLVDFILKQKNAPKVFITASGAGYYPSSSEVMTEDSAKGSGILAGICSEWEDASAPLMGTAIRRVVLRTGIVLSEKGGALEKLLPIFNFGLGGPVGTGKQFWSWIAMEDLIRIYNLAAKDPRIEGIYNAVAPIASTNKKFTDVLGSALRRPTLIRTPSWVLKIALGRMADDALLASQNIAPNRLNESDFNFNFPDLELAVSHCLGTY